jgi:RNA polymerase sigma-70 factor (ECF subfamily)
VTALWGKRRLRRLNDVDLMVRLGAGDVGAYREFYDRYCDRAYSMAVSICHEGRNAEEVVRQAFESVWQSRASLEPLKVTIAAMLLDSVRSRALEHNRRTAPPIFDPADASALAQVLPAPGHDADRFRDLVVRLPADLQEVITLAYYGRLSHGDIAVQLGLPLDTIRLRIRLGMQELKAGLAQTTA